MINSPASLFPFGTASAIYLTPAQQFTTINYGFARLMTVTIRYLEYVF